MEYYLLQGGDRSKVTAVLPLFSQNQVFTATKAPALLSTRKPPLDAMKFGQADQSRVSILQKVNGETKVVEVSPENTLVVSDVIDWVLFLGREDDVKAAPASLYQNKAYIKELYRRSKIVGDAFGFDLTSNVTAVDPGAKQ